MSTPPDTAAAGPVLVISSHVVRGSVGNRAAVFALEMLGHPVWALPTVILPWHLGHGPATRSMMPPEDFSAIIDDLCRAPWLAEIEGVLSGFLGRPEQAADIARLVDRIRESNPQAIYACDPVIGDHGSLYVSEQTAEAVRDTLIPRASIATPNRYELEWLTGLPADSSSAIIEAAMALGPDRVLVTSSPAMMAGSIGNILVSGGQALMAEHREIPDPPNGTGDLTAATFLSHILNGRDDEKALQDTTASVFEIVARTAKRGTDELAIESEAASLARPFAMVQMRRLTDRKPRASID